jgi:hypothetical protein
MLVFIYQPNERTEMSLMEIIEKRQAHARNTAQEFDRLGMEDSAEMWWLVVGVLDGVILEAKEQ